MENKSSISLGALFAQENIFGKYLNGDYLQTTRYGWLELSLHIISQHTHLTHVRLSPIPDPILWMAVWSIYKLASSTINIYTHNV